ncbi:2-phospho-L-lactate guanylyltransferase [Nesterenkonia populi]
MRISGTPDRDGFSLTVPVRCPSTGKSRLAAELNGPLAARQQLAEALARDTLEAAARCPAVTRLLLVTDDPGWTAGLPGEVLVQSRPGLTAAVQEGIAALGDAPRTAVMLGDLPALRPEDLGAALRLAARVPLGYVPDRAGTGTVLITAAAPARHRPQFGPSSARLHDEVGCTDLGIPATSALRCDADTLADLRAAAGIGLGPATAVAAHQLGLIAARAPSPAGAPA